MTLFLAYILGKIRCTDYCAVKLIQLSYPYYQIELVHRNFSPIVPLSYTSSLSYHCLLILLYELCLESQAIDDRSVFLKSRKLYT